jgi:hypothetical protein
MVPSRDEAARARYLTVQSFGALLLDVTLHPPEDPTDLVAMLHGYLDRMGLPTVELYTQGLLTDSTMLDAYLQFTGDPADTGPPGVDENFYRLACRLMAEDARRVPGALLHIATHDVPLSDRLLAYIDKNNIPQSAYEFAMLYGIQRGQQQRLAQARRPLRVLIAYGEYWFPWYMRRLAERPANLWFVVRNLTGA